MFVYYYYLVIKLRSSNTLEVGCYWLTISVPSSETSKLTDFPFFLIIVTADDM